MLKELRKNPVINKLVRSFIKTVGNSSENLFRIMSSKWRTSGNINCNFGEVDFKMYNQCDDGLVGYFYYGKDEYNENQDLKLFSLLAKRSNTIIDIGANTGLYTIITSKSNPKSKIYSIEPYSINYNRLLKNINLNKLENVVALNIALGAEEGQVNFSVPQNDNITDVSSVNGEFSRNFYPELSWKNISVSLRTLDNLSIEIGQKIDLIKCDVESYEMNVFNGAKRTLEKDRPAILFESFLDNERKAFFNAVLDDYNYYLYLVLKEGIVRLENGFDVKNNGLNFLISSKKTTETFTSFEQISNSPDLIIL